MPSTQTVTGVIASSVLNNLSSNNSNTSNANTTLQGLVQNLMAAESPDVIRAIATQITMTPYAGAAAQIAEHLLNDLKITDPVQQALAVQRDISYLQATVTAQAHQTGIVSSFLASLGL